MRNIKSGVHYRLAIAVAFLVALVLLSRLADKREAAASPKVGSGQACAICKVYGPSMADNKSDKKVHTTPVAR